MEVVPQDPRQELLKTVLALQELPLRYVAWLAGVAPRPSQRFRPYRIQKVKDHAQRTARENLANAGIRAADIDAFIERRLEVARAGGSAWALFWQELDFPVRGERDLDACVAVAIELDRLLAAVYAAAQDDRPQESAAAFAEFAQGLSLPQDVLASEDNPGLHPSDWRGVTQWGDVAVLGQHLLLAAYVDQFAHVDAVWGAAFVQQLQPRPLFLLVAPRRRGDACVDPPVRRLLQVCHALHHWARGGAWPARPARPAELNAIFEMDGGKIYNLLNDTARLRFLQFERAWPRFAAHFKLDGGVHFPAVLVAVAICWQHSLARRPRQGRLKSFSFLNEEAYTQLWRWRRAQLAAPSAGTAPWAAWMDG